jgi:hypothetical protein
MSGQRDLRRVGEVAAGMSAELPYFVVDDVSRANELVPA